MRHFLISATLILNCYILLAQVKLPPAGGSPKATVIEEIGITEVLIKYSRPSVKNRQGKIWGALVPYGFNSYNATTNKNTSPWRAGANENTIIRFEHDVKVQGHSLKAGTYGLFMAVGKDSTTVIFSQQNTTWGSQFYEASKDALRVTVKNNLSNQLIEFFEYKFENQNLTSVTVSMKWEYLIVSFVVMVDVDSIVISSLRNELQGHKGEYSANYVEAAQYCVSRNVNLDQALTWSLQAVNAWFGQRSFATLQNLATVYEKLNQQDKADSVMSEALIFATPTQYTEFARLLISQNNKVRALEVAKQNAAKNGSVFQVALGFMYVYSSIGDFKNAIKYGEIALQKASSEFSKQTITNNLEKLKNNIDINSL